MKSPLQGPMRGPRSPFGPQSGGSSGATYTPDHLWSSLNGPLWQLSNGTTAVSANNDPVGYWGDRVGSSHLIQATSGNRPFYQTPSIGLLFDGTNDNLAYAGSLADTTGSLTILFKTGSSIFQSRGTQVLFSSADTGTTNNWFEIGITNLGYIYIEANNGGTKHTMVGSTMLEVSTDYFLVLVHDGTGYVAYLNGYEQNPLVTLNEGTMGWFGDVSSPDNLVAGCTITSAGVVRPFQGTIREISTYSEAIVT